MGKSSNGPELTDCALYMRQIEEHHQVSVTILVTAGGSHGGLPVCLLAIALPSKLDDPWEKPAWTSERRWPCLNHRTYEGAVYGLLMDLDEVLTKARWEQSSFPA